jgi:CelD/BcsL family acetyltransferase involved in cellulose biosynthesis
MSAPQPTAVYTEPAATLAAEIQRGGPELIDAIAADWRALCCESGQDEPFFRPEWVRAYVVAFTSDTTLVLITVRCGDRLLAVLPLVERRVRLGGVLMRALCGAANVHSCRFDLICARGAEGERAASALWECVQRELQWDVVLLPDVPSAGAAHALLRAAQQDCYAVGQWDSVVSPWLSLAPTKNGDDIAQYARNSHFRQNLRRRWRKLNERGALRLRCDERASAQCLQRFYALESSGWKGAEGGAIACSPQTLRFYNEVAQAAQVCGYLALYFLECGDETVAAHFGLAYRGRYYCPKVAYAESFREYGPGQLILGAILRDLSARNFSEFDFVGGAAAWKDEWATAARSHDVLYIFGHTLRARASHACLFSVLKPIRDWARQHGMSTAWSRMVVWKNVFTRRLREAVAKR